ncbi:MAG: glycerol-3-phosphate 1-O-acyltransferase PlsY [Bacteroidetes bacterium]|jgi:glycerol-3-phosphate acyltransferase PlsY|nr:glycerol-3-phosphate 1-O-acyltransferase PlsY [Bacteroidota bacterium]
MPPILKIATLLLAYLLGSIPTAVWIGNKFFDTDVREHGSKNAGATNTMRVLGFKPGLIVLLIDVLKGWIAVNLVRFSDAFVLGSSDYVTFQLLLGAGVILGHIFPLYANFKGGKGVATLLGVVLALHAPATLICMGIFLIILFTTRYVSLGSMAAGFAFPILVILVFKTTTPPLVIFSLVISVLLLLTHQKNIERLLNHEENKVRFLKKRNKEE